MIGRRILSRTRWSWFLLGIMVIGFAAIAALKLSSWDCAECRGTPIAVLGYSYHKAPFHVTIEFKDRPQPQIAISAAGTTDELSFALSGVSSCKAVPATTDAKPDLTLYPSVLNSYFPLEAVPELRGTELKRVTLTAAHSYPIVCNLVSPSQHVSYDSHIVRFVKALTVPVGSAMTLSQSDTYRIDQLGIDSVRLDDTFGSVSITKGAPLFSALVASRDAIPAPDTLTRSIVTSAEWTDKDDSHQHEFYILLLGAVAGGGFACFIEAFRSVFQSRRTLVKRVSLSRFDGR